MIPLKLAPEPPEFDEGVRQRGLAAIDELVGRTPRRTRPGPRRKKVASTEAEIPSSEFPAFWRDVLPAMLNAYERRCAFLALHIELATGGATVDHMIPKSREWKLVYEWHNYRLCCAHVNSLKSDSADLVDPFECEENWFALEIVEFRVVPGDGFAQATNQQYAAIRNTLELLNSRDCCEARRSYFDAYREKHVSWQWVLRRAPFVAREMLRQELVSPEDLAQGVNP